MAHVVPAAWPPITLQLVIPIADPSSFSSPILPGGSIPTPPGDGVELGGGLGTSAPAIVSLESAEERSSVVRITIGEGKNRQVRRMLHGVGHGCLELERIRIGGHHHRRRRRCHRHHRHCHRRHQHRLRLRHRLSSFSSGVVATHQAESRWTAWKRWARGGS